MQDNSSVKSLLAAASRSLKTQNQDACAVVRNETAGLNALLVADGVGSHYGAAEAACVAVEAARRSLLEVSDEAIPRPGDLIRLAQRELAGYVRSLPSLPPGLNADNGFGTTLLCAVEVDGQILAGYTGNGALIHIRGNFNDFPTSKLAPWSAMNYLNPHSLFRHGRNVLFHIVSPFIHPARYTELSFSKDDLAFGDLVLLCTDGLCSYDQASMGRDLDQGLTWIQYEPRLLMLLERLNSFLRGGDYTDDALQQTLEEYLNELVEKSMIEDDCTLAVLISARALEYQSKAGASGQNRG